MEITKLQLVREVNNDKTHNWYFLCRVRFYNPDRTRFRRFAFVVWFDSDEVCEYYDDDKISKKKIKDYAGEIAANSLPTALAYDDIDGIKAFSDFCRESIDEYNANVMM